jgi:hypothetical protein
MVLAVGDLAGHECADRAKNRHPGPGGVGVEPCREVRIERRVSVVRLALGAGGGGHGGCRCGAAVGWCGRHGVGVEQCEHTNGRVHRSRHLGVMSVHSSHRRLAESAPQPTTVHRSAHRKRVHLLFAARARGMSTAYINNTIIPMLCRKAGVPTVDVRGAITSHRARSTIASQLYNAKEPMTLFELQAWLGHRSPHPPSTTRRSAPPHHPDPGLPRRRLLRPQHTHHRGPHRPRRRDVRRRRIGPTVAALRSRPRLLQLHLLRAVSTSDGLRSL